MKQLRFIILVVLCGLLFMASSAALAQSEEGMVVPTIGGDVRGVQENNLLTFKGIPYAAPPVGERRWMPPEPVAAWDGVRDASEFGAACAQTFDEFEITEDTALSEDCLTLNVWTPAADDAARPVLVWIHGGGFSWGSTLNDLYDGSQFARRGDIVVVSLQYRLGPFGWLHLEEVGGDAYAGSGNLGLLDQMAALAWVQENIAAFGGDPNNVTVAGESAGGISIGALLTSPMADGLFQKAILQSGSPGLIATKDWAKGVTRMFMEIAEIETVEDLHELSTEEILTASETLFNSQFSDTAFHPVIDGHVIPEAPMQVMQNNPNVNVPVMLGTTLDEVRYWLFYSPELDRLPLDYIRPWLNEITQDNAEAVIETYQQSRPDYSDPQVGLAIVGDVAFRMPSIRFAESLASHDVPVWMYLLTLPSPLENGRYGSPHAIDLPFTFHNLDAEGGEFLIGQDEAYEQIADQVQDRWIAFIHSGDPNQEGLSDWPMYNTNSRPTMIFDREIKSENDPLAEEREVWGEIPFDGLNPSLGLTNPLTYEGTKITPRIVMGMIGPVWTAVMLLGIIAIIAVVLFLVRKILQRRHRAGS